MKYTWCMGKHPSIRIHCTMYDYDYIVEGILKMSPKHNEKITRKSLDFVKLFYLGNLKKDIEIK